MNDDTTSGRLAASERARTAGRAVLTGERGGLRAFLPFVGPAVIASVAYMDPGNFATN
ncbi:MAG TPA: divalent metal cation transporter, partial [Xanthobacteraceae bacterium]|nr:divalent metal cation transporter [Xanthobacteraceae bacterium]